MTTTTAVQPVTMPTKAKPTGMYVYHNTNDELSFGLQLDPDGTVTGALAVCSPRDNFSKKHAWLVLTNRLETRRLNSRVRLTFSLGKYTGTEFKDDVFTPLMSYVRDNAYLYMLDSFNRSSRMQQNDLLNTFVESIEKIKEHKSSNLV